MKPRSLLIGAADNDIYSTSTAAVAATIRRECISYDRACCVCMCRIFVCRISEISSIDCQESVVSVYVQIGYVVVKGLLVLPLMVVVITA